MKSATDQTFYAQASEFLPALVTIDGRDYELCRRVDFDPYFAGESRPEEYDEADRLDIIQFVDHESYLSGDLDLALFLDHLLVWGYIVPSDYPAVIEFGNEVTYGAGETWLRKYEVTVRRK